MDPILVPWLFHLLKQGTVVLGECLEMYQRFLHCYVALCVILSLIHWAVGINLTKVGTECSGASQ